MLCADNVDVVGLAFRLQRNRDPLTQYLASHLRREEKTSLTKCANGLQSPETIAHIVLRILNDAIADPDFYSPQNQDRFAHTVFSRKTKCYIKAAGVAIDNMQLCQKRNTSLLEDAYHEEIVAEQGIFSLIDRFYHFLFWAYIVLLVCIFINALSGLQDHSLSGCIMRLVATLFATQLATTFGLKILRSRADRYYRQNHGRHSPLGTALEFLCNIPGAISNAAAMDYLNQTVPLMSMFILILGEWVAYVVIEGPSRIAVTIYCPFIAVLVLLAYLVFVLGNDSIDPYRRRSLAHRTAGRLRKLGMLVPPASSQVTSCRGIMILIYTIMIVLPCWSPAESGVASTGVHVVHWEQNSSCYMDLSISKIANGRHGEWQCWGLPLRPSDEFETLINPKRSWRKHTNMVAFSNIWNTSMSYYLPIVALGDDHNGYLRKVLGNWSDIDIDKSHKIRYDMCSYCDKGE